MTYLDLNVILSILLLTNKISDILNQIHNKLMYYYPFILILTTVIISSLFISCIIKLICCKIKPKRKYDSMEKYWIDSNYDV